MVLKDKVAFITGGSRGLGRAVALLFAREGAKVAIAARERESLTETARLARELGAQVLPVSMDLQWERDVDDAFGATLDALGPVDILVNAAGTALIKKLAETTIEEWRTVIETNLTGVFLTCRAAARQMLEYKLKGRIVNVSSTSGKTGSAMITAYSASKAAVIGFTQSLGKELAPHGIRANTVCPGAMDTEMLHRDTLGVLATMYGSTREALLKSTINAIPIKRIISPDEVAQVILLLARGDVDAFVGQAVNVSGGFELH